MKKLTTTCYYLTIVFKLLVRIQKKCINAMTIDMLFGIVEVLRVAYRTIAQKTSTMNSGFVNRNRTLPNDKKYCILFKDILKENLNYFNTYIYMYK